MPQSHPYATRSRLSNLLRGCAGAVLLWPLIAGCAAGLNADETYDGLYDIGPYVLLSAPGELLVAVDASLTDAPLVEWHVVAGDSITASGVVAERDNDRWLARVPVADIHAPVQYRVRSERGVGPWLTARIGRARGEPFRIALYGGTHDDAAIHGTIVDEIAGQRIDLAVHTGNAVAHDTRDDWAHFFAVESALLGGAPLIVAPGFADGGADRYVRDYLHLPDRAPPARYFTRDWGDLRIVAIDPGPDCALDQHQRYRASGALADARRNGMFALILVHPPPYSSAHDPCGERLLPEIRALADTHRVHLVVSSSTHGYERTVLDGTVYLATGTAGSHPRAVSPTRRTRAYAPVPHYVLVDVESGSLAIRALDARGQALDATTVAAR